MTATGGVGVFGEEVDGCGLSFDKIGDVSVESELFVDDKAEVFCF